MFHSHASLRNFNEKVKVFVVVLVYLFILISINTFTVLYISINQIFHKRKMSVAMILEYILQIENTIMYNTTWKWCSLDKYKF